MKTAGLRERTNTPNLVCERLCVIMDFRYINIKSKAEVERDYTL